MKDDDDDEGVHAPAQLINNNYMPQQQQQPAYNTMPQQYEQEYEQVEQYQPEMAAQGGGATYPTPATPPKSRETSHVTGFSSPRQDGNSYANDVTPFGSSVTDVGSSARPPPDASRGSLVGEDFSTSAKSEQFKVMARRVHAVLRLMQRGAESDQYRVTVHFEINRDMLATKELYPAPADDL